MDELFTVGKLQIMGDSQDPIAFRKVQGHTKVCSSYLLIFLWGNITKTKLQPTAQG